MEKYKCKTCGKNHNIFRGMRSPIPDLIAEMPKKSKKKRLKEIQGFYILDNQWVLIPGYIYIYLEDRPEPFFFWEAWVKIEIEKFEDNLQDLAQGKLTEVIGEIESLIPFYKESKGLKAKIIIHPFDEQEIEIKIIENSIIKEDQTKPISRDRMMELLEQIDHPELYTEKTVFDKPFTVRLREELLNAEKNYIKKRKNFAINISDSRSVLFQIISNKMLETVSKIRGFGLHFAFDESFEESIEELKKFKNQSYSKNFQYYELEAVPTYQIDLGNNKSSIENVIINIIEDVYEVDIEEIGIDSFKL